MRLNECANNNVNLDELELTDISKTVGEKVRWTRFIHRISAQRTAEIISMYHKNRQITYSTINAWENFKSRPTVEALMSFADVFGISILWLTGRSDCPYDQQNLLALESNLLPLTTERMFIDYAKQHKIIKLFPLSDFPLIMPQYLFDNTRAEYYSPNVRGNIIFALNLYMHWITNNKDQTYQTYSDEEAYMMKIYDNIPFPLALLIYYLTSYKHLYTRKTFEGYTEYTDAFYCPAMTPEVYYNYISDQKSMPGWIPFRPKSIDFKSCINFTY